MHFNMQVIVCNVIMEADRIKHPKDQDPQIKFLAKLWCSIKNYKKLVTSAKYCRYTIQNNLKICNASGYTS